MYQLIGDAPAFCIKSAKCARTRQHLKKMRLTLRACGSLRFGFCCDNKGRGISSVYLHQQKYHPVTFVGTAIALLWMREKIMATTDTNTTRIQFELDNAFLSLIDKEREKANIPTRKQYIEYAFALMGWAVTESQKGKKIASMDETTHQFREITMPPLDFARRQGALLN